MIPEFTEEDREKLFSKWEPEELTIYVYQCHLGDLYVSREELPEELLHCEECGDSDRLLFVAHSELDIAHGLREQLDIFGCSGFSSEYLLTVYDEGISLLEELESTENKTESEGHCNENSC